MMNLKPSLGLLPVVALLSQSPSHAAENRAKVETTVETLHQELIARSEEGLFPMDPTQLRASTPEPGRTEHGAYARSSRVDYDLSSYKPGERKRIDRLANAVTKDLSITTGMSCWNFGKKDHTQIGMTCEEYAPFTGEDQAELEGRYKTAEQALSEGVKACESKYFHGIEAQTPKLEGVDNRTILAEGSYSPHAAPKLQEFYSTDLSADPLHATHADTGCLIEAVKGLSLPENCSAKVNQHWPRNQGIRASQVDLVLECTKPGPFAE